MQFVAFYNLNIRTGKILDVIGKIVAGVPAICQNFLTFWQIRGGVTDHRGCARAVRDIRRCDEHRMGQSQHIDPNMQFYSGSFFPAS
jgi:hypothetical protein